jgi:hypothetical protein
LNWYVYSSDQKELIKNNQEKFKSPLNNKIAAIQIQEENEFLKRFISFSNENNYSPIGFDFNRPHYKILDLVFFPFFIIKILEQFFLVKKGFSFHKKLGLNKFLMPNLTVLRSIKYFPKSLIIFLKLKSKKDVLQIKHEGIIIGDLIYDTYIRYFKKSTLSISDFNLIFLLSRTYGEINYLNKVSKLIDIYLTGYTAYTNAGLPARIFIKNGVEVYTFSNFIFGKKLSINDFSQTKKYWDYKIDFAQTENKDHKIAEGLRLIQNRLKGINDLWYMKSNSYLPSDQIEIKKYDGIIFLHDFTDSGHIYRWSLFEDFYEWILFSFNLIEKHNLNIAIKPHPNQNITSKKIVDKLKKEYSQLNWIDERTPNSKLFASGIKFGISVYGTVLSELAFKNIIPICCGDNPTINYDFIFNVNTKEQYKDYIINYNKLIFKNNRLDEIGEFVYMNHIN